jgi:hypothetical protein
MDTVVIIIATMVGLHLISYYLRNKGKLMPQKCSLHKWYYGADGDMICSVCNKKPGEVMK